MLARRNSSKCGSKCGNRAKKKKKPLEIEIEIEIMSPGPCSPNCDVSSMLLLYYGMIYFLEKLGLIIKFQLLGQVKSVYFSELNEISIWTLSNLILISLLSVVIIKGIFDRLTCIKTYINQCADRPSEVRCFTSSYWPGEPSKSKNHRTPSQIKFEDLFPFFVVVVAWNSFVWFVLSAMDTLILF